MTFLRRTLLCSLLFAANPLPGHAQQVITREYHFSSGSGVVVDMLGHVLTNRHVLKQHCETIQIVIQGNTYTAQVVAAHPTLDLVLLQTIGLTNPQPLPLRDGRQNPNVGEEALVLGFPGEYAIREELKATPTTILALEGPMKETYWLQFANAAQQGNSGGPLVDKGGNVLGIIQGKTEIQTLLNGRQEGDAKLADVAITAAEVGRFLNEQRVAYSTHWLSSVYAPDVLRQYLAHSIPNVRCILPEGMKMEKEETMPAPAGYQLKGG